MTQSLWTHQIEGVEGAIVRLNDYGAAMLDYGMGTGKSRIAIEIVNRLIPHRVLIVAPKVTVEGSWPGQLEQWLNVGHKIVILDRGSAAKRSEVLRDVLESNVSCVAVLNYEMAIRYPLNKMIESVEWDMTIFDESHRLKSPGTARTGFFVRLSHRGRLGKKLMLSGTPMPNGLEELYSQYNILNPKIFGTSFTLFKSVYCVQEPAYRDAPRYVTKVVGYRNKEDFERRRSVLAIVRRTEDCLDLPSCIERELSVELKPRTLKMIRELTIQGLTHAPDGSPIAPETAAVRAIKSMMLSSGVLKYDTELGETKIEFVDDSKMKALESLLEDVSNERVVVFARWVRDLQTTRESAKKFNRDYFEISGDETRQRGETLDAWRATSNGVIAVQIQSGGEGIDLTASRIGIFISRSHSAGQHKQAIARLVRHGQTRPVYITSIVGRVKIDEAVTIVLNSKIDSLEELHKIHLSLLKSERRRR